jgi:hypothetical protein
MNWQPDAVPAEHSPQVVAAGTLSGQELLAKHRTLPSEAITHSSLYGQFSSLFQTDTTCKPINIAIKQQIYLDVA